LNHLIVWAEDRRSAAEFLSEIAGMGPPTESRCWPAIALGTVVPNLHQRREEDLGTWFSEHHP
jgi:hypothetical protein